MNHYTVLNACMRAIDRCRAEGYVPQRLFLPNAAIEELKRFPIDGQATLATIRELRGVPVEEREFNPCVVGKPYPTAIVSAQYTVDLSVAALPVKLAFEVTIRGSYTPPKEVYGGVTDPEQWAAMDEGRIVKDLPRFCAILPTVAPDADIVVHVEPERPAPAGDAFTVALSKLARADTAPSGFRAMIALADAERSGSSGKRAMEFAHAISALEEAEWRFRRGVEMHFFDETA